MYFVLTYTPYIFLVSSSTFGRRCSELVAWLLHHGNGVFLSELPFGGGERQMVVIDRLPEESMGLGVFGCEVRLVAQGGLAAEAGLQEGDLILKINGRVRATSL